MFCFRIFINISVSETDQCEDSVDSLNYRYKWMMKLEMETILNPELLHDDPKLYNFMQVHESEEDKDVNLPK